MEKAAELSPEQHYRQGLSLLEQGKGESAFEHFSRAYELDPKTPRYRSFYALALALVKREFLGAADLARTALQQEFYNPDLYLNLANIYLAHGFKAEAVRVLRRGMMVDPGNGRLARKLESLGLRRRPPIPFLPRGHAANRVLGRALSWLLERLDAISSRLSRA